MPTLHHPFSIAGEYNEDGHYYFELDFESTTGVPEYDFATQHLYEPDVKLWNEWIKKKGLKSDIIESVNDAIYDFIEDKVPELITEYAKYDFRDFKEEKWKEARKKEKQEKQMTIETKKAKIAKLQAELAELEPSEKKEEEEPIICSACKRDFTDEVDDRSSFDEIGKIICMDCFDKE